MLLNFKYVLSESLAKLAKVEIVGIPINNDVSGWVDQADINANLLNHCSLYLCCESETYENNLVVQSNPMVIVAKNMVSALVIFHKVTGKTNGTIKCEILNNCAKLKVIPTGYKIE